MCLWLQRRRSSWPLRQLGVPFDPKGVPLASEGSWDPKMVTWLPKYVICKVMTFIEGFMEAELMVTSSENRQGEYRSICLWKIEWQTLAKRQTQREALVCEALYSPPVWGHSLTSYMACNPLILGQLTCPEHFWFSLDIVHLPLVYRTSKLNLFGSPLFPPRGARVLWWRGSCPWLCGDDQHEKTSPGCGQVCWRQLRHGVHHQEEALLHHHPRLWQTSGNS